jgi:hypothetical protein
MRESPLHPGSHELRSSKEFEPPGKHGYRFRSGRGPSRLAMLIAFLFLCVSTAVAQDKIDVKFARIGCLDIQKDGNLAQLVAQACNGKTSCSYKAPTETEYRRAGVQAKTRTFCTQAMEVIYECGHNDPHNIMVPGDAWTKPPAELVCNPGVPQNTTLPLGAAPINVVKARIGCLDIQKDGNLTDIVGRSCNGRLTCSYEAPTPDQYAREGVRAATRTFCTQAMEITYRCGQYNDKTALVNGDAWVHPPAYLDCQPGSEGSNVVNSKRLDARTVLWRIDEPTVTQPTTAYQQIQFHPGDEIEVTAGGCVQTSNHGSSWKSYTLPLGENAARFYSGTIMIPGVIPSGAQGYERIGGWMGKALRVPTSLPPTIRPSDLYLNLGYQDDVYRDNGYGNHDDGNPPQCVGIGNAWVELKVTSGVIAAGPAYSPHQKPFDLVWDMLAGVDGNGLPLNPLWAFQLDSQGALPDFREICGRSFPNNGTVNDSTLASLCTTQLPTTDFPTGLSAINCGVGGPINPDNLLKGHLNWALATGVGNLYWEEDSLDGDFNFKLKRPDNAALTTLNIANDYGLHLEFNEDESISNFKAPFWRNLQGGVESLNSSANNAAYASINGKLAVVTGLMGIDGVHGGYTESHPVFSMAIRTQEQVEAGGIDESWAFFMRNSGGEGDCSSLTHYWYGMSDGSGGSNWYFIQLPVPAGATGASVNTNSSEVWANHPGISAPVITADSQWAYIGFQMPRPESGPELDGQITLHYARPSSSPPPAPAPAPAPARSAASALLVRRNVSGGDGWEELRKRITNPADLEKFETTLRAQRVAMVRPKPHTLQLHVAPTVASHRPLAATPGHKGVLTRDRAVEDPAVTNARRALEQKMLTVIPKTALPPNVDANLIHPR